MSRKDDTDSMLLARLTDVLTATTEAAIAARVYLRNAVCDFVAVEQARGMPIDKVIQVVWDILRKAEKSGAIRRIHSIRTMHLGPEDVLATARIDFEDTVSAARVEGIVGDLEEAIKARFPEIRHLFLAAKGE